MKNILCKYYANSFAINLRKGRYFEAIDDVIEHRNVRINFEINELEKEYEFQKQLLIENIKSIDSYVEIIQDELFYITESLGIEFVSKNSFFQMLTGRITEEQIFEVLKKPCFPDLEKLEYILESLPVHLQGTTLENLIKTKVKLGQGGKNKKRPSVFIPILQNSFNVLYPACNKSHKKIPIKDDVYKHAKENGFLFFFDNDENGDYTVVSTDQAAQKWPQFRQQKKPVSVERTLGKIYEDISDSFLE